MVYKLVSIVIVNIFRGCRSAFVKDRLIVDKVVVTFEAFHSMFYSKINNANHFALKLDLSKAFDRVEWNYFEVVMVAIKIPSSMASLRIKCVHIVCFSVLINGLPSPSFTPID